jgi:protein ImuB
MKLNSGTRLFAVVHTPAFRLQCAQHRLWAIRLSTGESFDAKQLQLSFAVTDSGSNNDYPNDQNLPAALLDSSGELLVELNSAALASGVQIGMSPSQALARISDLTILAANPDTESRAQAALLQLCYRYSPYLAEISPGACTLDLQGRRDKNSEWWARELLMHWRSLGFSATIGLGPNPELALQAAQIANPYLEIDSKSPLLQSLPIAALKPSPYLNEILLNWGIRTVGALHRLSREDVGQRLGLEGLALWDRAAGRGVSTLELVQPPATFIESVELEHPVETLEPLLFLLQRFLERLSVRIDAVYRLIGELCVTLLLDNKESIVRTLQIPAPTNNVDTLFRISSQYLETVQTTSPILGLTVEGFPSQPGKQQLNYLETGLKDPNRFFLTLGRLAALVGNDRIGFPQRQNTHKPDSLDLHFPTGNWSKKTDNTQPIPRIGLPLRRYRPGVPVEVELVDGKPKQIRATAINGTIKSSRGPWHSSGNWWDQSRWRQQEWDIVLENGGVYCLVCQENRWFLAGMYD